VVAEGSVVSGGAGEVAIAQAGGIAFERDDLGVVDEVVDHRGGDDVVAEDLWPLNALPGDRVLAGARESTSGTLAERWPSRSRAITRGRAGRLRRGRGDESGSRARSWMCTRPRAAPTALCASPPSCGTAARSSSATTWSNRACANSASRSADPPAAQGRPSGQGHFAGSRAPRLPPRRAPTGSDDRHQRAPHARRPALLLRRARRVPAHGRRLGHRQLPAITVFPGPDYKNSPER
jgi:hypothetical protein